MLTLVGFSINAAEGFGFEPGAVDVASFNALVEKYKNPTLEDIQGALCFSDDEDDEISQKQKEITILKKDIFALQDQLGRKRVVKKPTSPAAPRDFRVITLQDIQGALCFSDDEEPREEVIARKNAVITMLQATKLGLEGALRKKEQLRKKQLRKEQDERDRLKGIERRAGVHAAFNTKYTTAHESPREEFPDESNFVYACLMVDYDAALTKIEEGKAQLAQAELAAQAELEKQRQKDAPAAVASLSATGFATPPPVSSYNALGSVVATQRKEGDGGPTAGMTPGSAAALDGKGFRATAAALKAAVGSPAVRLTDFRKKKGGDKVKKHVESTPGSVVLAATAPIVATVAQEVVSSPIIASAPLTPSSDVKKVVTGANGSPLSRRDQRKVRKNRGIVPGSCD